MPTLRRVKLSGRLIRSVIAKRKTDRLTMDGLGKLINVPVPTLAKWFSREHKIVCVGAKKLLKDFVEGKFD
ncbi:MAG: hypothetical protein WCO30_01245 [bacterium]